MSAATLAADALLTARERILIAVLQAIVTETMDFPPHKRIGDDSHLPPEFIDDAQTALGLYGFAVPSVGAPS